MPKYGCLVNYYGSKSKMASKYPKPSYEMIVEPFAGMAAYSLLHCEKKVILNDMDDRVVAIWRAMLTMPIDEILSYIPLHANQGDRVSAFIDKDTPFGIVQMMRACANVGAFGDKGVYDVITPFASKSWESGSDGMNLIHRRLRYWHPRIQHWEIYQGSYDDLPNHEATWFVDPPYSGGAPGSGQKGSEYKHWKVDYPHLAQWVMDRNGQTITCEQKGASWLSFEVLGLMMSTGFYGPVDTVEVVHLGGKLA
jgi:site-specific DNA-adenine methylase